MSIFIKLKALLLILSVLLLTTQGQCPAGLKASKTIEVTTATTAKKNNIIGCLKTDKKIIIELGFLFTSLKTQPKQGILQIGNTEHGIYLNKQTNALDFVFEKQTISIPLSKIEFDINKDFKAFIEVTQTRIKIIIDDIPLKNVAKTTKIAILKDVPVYLSDPTNEPAAIKIVSLTIAASGTAAVEPGNGPAGNPGEPTPSGTVINCGNNPGPFEPGIVSGDPHFITFNKGRHDFQGETDGFYYYMKPCTFKGYTNQKEMPFNLIGKNYNIGEGYKSLEYVILQVFDGIKTYSVYVREKEVSYTVTRSTFIETIEKASRTNVVSGTKVSLGGKTLTYTQENDGARVALQIPTDKCKNAIEFIVRGQSQNEKGRWVEHAMTVSVPECYACYTCCLLGDFYNKGNKLFHPITGKVLNSDTGKPPYNAIAYQDAYFGCRVLDIAATVSPTKPKTRKPCDDATIVKELEKYCKAKLDTFKQSRPQCCKGKEKECEYQINNCITDSCVCVGKLGVGADLSTQQIKDCTNKEIDNLMIEICNRKPSAPAKTKSPTKKPTPKPTPKPTTKAPTKGIPKSCPVKGDVGIASGDPHFTQFNGAEHNYMGKPGFAYLVQPCFFKKLNNKEIPFNLIGSIFRVYPKEPLTTIEYVILEVFTDTERYYIYIRGTDVSYYKESKNVRRDIKKFNKVQRNEVTPGTTIVLSKTMRVKTEYTTVVDDFDEMEITLIIDGIKCKEAFKFVVIPQAMDDNGVVVENSVDVEVPKCYKCGICGLLGDFWNKGHKMFNPKTGKIINTYTGEPPMYNKKAYNEAYFGVRVKQTGYKPLKFGKNEILECSKSKTMFNHVKRKCKEFFNVFTLEQYPTCCNAKNMNDCREQIKNCYTDACVCIQDIPYNKRRKGDNLANCAQKTIENLLPPACAAGVIIKKRKSALQGIFKTIDTEFVNNKYGFKNYIAVGIIALCAGIFIGLSVFACVVWLCCKIGNNKIAYEAVDNYSSSDDED